MFSLNTALELPEWYRLERQTEKTIGKLVNLKELDYYLRNPDEYLRRLALIRLSQLKPRDCENILREILDDHYESNENKELAAWVLKAVVSKWNMEIFIDNRYLTKFTGNEKLEDLYKINFNELQPSLRLNFSANLVCSQLPASEDTLASERISFIEANLDLKQWWLSVTKNFWVNAKPLLLKFMKVTIKAMGKLVHFVFIVLPSLLFNRIKNVIKRKKSFSPEKRRSSITDSNNGYNMPGSRTYNNPDLMPLVMKSRKIHKYKPSAVSSLVSAVKKVVFNVLYVFFYPARLFLKHKFAFVFILLALYIFLNFTNQGSILFREYTGEEFLQFQTTTINHIKQFSLSAWKDFKDFSGLDAFLAKDGEKVVKNSDPAPSYTELYSVIAAKGLNIRKAPDPNSEKVTGGSLAFGSIVTFLDKLTTDSAGRTWFYVKAEDGRTGWVSAKYLTVKKEG